MKKRYQSFNQAMQMMYGHKVYKISLDGGMRCPNRDGTIGTGGCIFCDGGSGAYAQKRIHSLSEQLDAAKARIQKKAGNNCAYMAYFQSYTNTYAPVEYLRKLFLPVLEREDICGISIATRPDCLSKPVLDLLQEMQKIKPVFVELGLQTIHAHTAEYIRRGYPLEVYDRAMQDLHRIGVHTVVHMILGLPGESKADMLKTAAYIADSGAEGIKLQLLHVLEGTDLAAEYREGKFETLDMQTYIEILADCIRILPPRMIIHRLTGDGEKSKLVAPLWSSDKKKVLNTITAEFEKRDVQQGQYYTGERNP